MKKGLFITFEGNDGSGKTTIAKKVHESLQAQGYSVIYTREPGGIEIAEKIRDIILDPQNQAMDSKCEALLYAASRRQHLVEKVIPALHQNKIVLCDRFIDSSLAYQGIGRNLGIDQIYQLNEFAIEGYMPDLTIFLSIPVEIGRARAKKGNHNDRMEQQEASFYEAVSQGYQMIQKKFHQRIVEINANQELKLVYEDVIQVINKVIQANE